MTETIRLGEVSIRVTRKDVKNVHLTVHPPNGRVTLTAPAATRLEVARAYGQFLKTFVIAREDRAMVQQIEALGVKAVCSDIRMNVLLDKKRLAGEVLALLGK